MIQDCKICKAETKNSYHPVFGNFFHCHQCDFIFKDEEDHFSKEEELKQYNQHNNSIHDPKYVNFFKHFLNDAVFPFVNKGKEGFDFGSGPSPVLAQLLNRDYQYEMAIYDLYYSPEKVYEGHKYDLVTSTEVVEHLKHPLDTFKLFAELLKPDGVLAVMTLFHPNQTEAFKEWHYIRDRTHISFYTPKTMEYIAEKVGLKIVYTDNNRYTTFKLDA